ncbi:MAG: DUF547 domain-containing protein [Bacteroidota bacterium]
MKKRRLVLFSIIAVLLLFFGYMKYHKLNVNDIGLKGLSWVKKVKGQAVDFSDLEKEYVPTVDHDIWTKLLQKHVSLDGMVNYEGFINDSIDLNQYLSLLKENSPGENWSASEKLAYWINVYNAFTVKLIVDHYPLESIKNISDGFAMINSSWDLKFFSIGDIPFDLNTVEHEILRKQFDEPRIHFAINCASVSCPKLRKEAFYPDQLETQLEDQAIAFLNNPEKNIISQSETRLSKIFDWFKSDFNKEADLKSYIQKYRPGLNPQNKITFMEYNWGLNN